MSFMEVKFEYAVECESISDGEYKTAKEAKDAAVKRWQEMCDEEDGYCYGRGDVTLYCLNADTGKILMSGEYRVRSQDGMTAKQIGGGE